MLVFLADNDGQGYLLELHLLIRLIKMTQDELAAAKRQILVWLRLQDLLGRTKPQFKSFVLLIEFSLFAVKNESKHVLTPSEKSCNLLCKARDQNSFLQLFLEDCQGNWKNVTSVNLLWKSVGLHCCIFFQ